MRWPFGIFNQIKYKVTVRVTWQICFAFIYSRIKYGIGVCGICSATNLSKIQVLQNNLMKLLLNIDRFTPTDTYFELKQNTYDLRTRRQMTVPQDRIVLGDIQSRFRGAQLWNRLPKDMLERRFKKSFKTNLTKNVWWVIHIEVVRAAVGFTSITQDTNNDLTNHRCLMGE